MSRPRTFPPEIYISVEEEGTDDEFLSVNKSPEDVAEVSKQKRIGRYMLAEVLKVEGKAVITGTFLDQCHPSFRARARVKKR